MASRTQLPGLEADLGPRRGAAREALGGRVYDVLGELFDGVALKDLLFEAPYRPYSHDESGAVSTVR